MFILTRKWLIALLIGLLIFFQYRLWLGSEGIFDMLRLRNQLNNQVKENQKLATRNRALVEQVKILQNNKEMVESHARSELGMTKKDEVFYQAVNE